MTKFQFRPAVRQNTKPLIALYGLSGSGKTYSALLLARGIVGPEGRIAMIDTETGRGSLYADVMDGGYDVLELEDPFQPKRYLEAITEAEKHAECIIIDSMSHEWEGLGGVLDMARNAADGKDPEFRHWKKPKEDHAKLIQKLLRVRVPMIICLRAKYKNRMVKVTKNGKDKHEVVKDEHMSPVQSEDFIFEMTAHAEVLMDHSIHLTKCSHPDLRKCFPEQGPIQIQHGINVAEWARGSDNRKKNAELDDGSENGDLIRNVDELIKTIEIAPTRPALEKLWENHKAWMNTLFPGDKTKIDDALKKRANIVDNKTSGGDNGQEAQE